jgi:two-component system, OmpR family, response regulator RegX3
MNALAMLGMPRRVSSSEPRPAVPIPTVLRVAVVEDDPTHLQLLGRWLEQAGHRFYHFEHGEAAIEACKQQRFDVLVLDWNVRGISGVDVLRRVRRSERASLPILFMSARSSEDDVVTALKQGADDYIVKPARRLELIARLEALARRGEHVHEPVETLEVDPYRVDFRSRILWRDGRALDLTAKDFDLSGLFLRNVGHLLTRRQIMESVWGTNAAITSRTLDTHISRIRIRLGLTPEKGWHLSAVYGHGYRLSRLRSELCSAGPGNKIQNNGQD